MTATPYDLIVLGAGCGGVRAALLAAQAGRKAAIIEESRLGGTALFHGAFPRAFLGLGAGLGGCLHDAVAFGWRVDPADFDWARLVNAKNAEVNRQEFATLEALREAGIDLIEGHGRLAAANVVAVGRRLLTAPVVLIATGSLPDLPDLPGIEYAVTSNEALDLMQLPGRAVVLGDGPVAVEFASMFNALGVAVTLLAGSDQLLPGYDSGMAAALAATMREQGIDVRLGAELCAIEREADGSRVFLAPHRRPADAAAAAAADGETPSDDDTGDDDDDVTPAGEEIPTDLVLAATGRVPNTAGLGLREVGVDLTAGGGIAVDGWSRSSVAGVWAIGDVTSRSGLATAALAEADAFVRTAICGVSTAIDHDGQPRAIHTLPPLAWAGLGEEEARRRHGVVETHLAEVTAPCDALSGHRRRSLIKLVTEPDDGRVLGVHVLGPGAAEIVQGFAVALRCGATKAQFDATLPVYSTLAGELVSLRRPMGGRAAAERRE